MSSLKPGAITRPAFTLRRNKLLWRLWLAFSTYCALWFFFQHTHARRELLDKFRPTKFPADLTIHHSTIVEGSDLPLRARLLAGRAHWRRLGSGVEGTAYAWEGYVIKAYGNRTPYRNCVPDTLKPTSSLIDATSPVRWPPELPATLLWSGIPGIIPAIDVFSLTSFGSNEPQWYLVTPLISGGDLDRLAGQLRESESASTTLEDIEDRFRPRLLQLLGTLASLHSAGFCHDDIKPDNIWINSTGMGYAEDWPWLLADLGNVRELSHAYHQTTLWKTMREQLADCRSNDLRHVLKTYLLFLRNSLPPDQHIDFDERFWRAEEGWARLYWRSMARENDLHVRELMAWLHEADETADGHYVIARQPSAASGMLGMARQVFLGRRRLLAWATARELSLAMGTGWLRHFALTWFLRMPTEPC